MTEQAKRPVSISEMNGRIDEIEAQRNSALARAAVLSGEKLLALELLRLAEEEIDKLREDLSKAQTRVEELEAEIKANESISINRTLVPAQDAGLTINH